jgi:hypothetical protein
MFSNTDNLYYDSGSEPAFLEPDDFENPTWELQDFEDILRSSETLGYGLE